MKHIKRTTTTSAVTGGAGGTGAGSGHNDDDYDEDAEGDGAVTHTGDDIYVTVDNQRKMREKITILETELLRALDQCQEQHQRVEVLEEEKKGLVEKLDTLRNMTGDGSGDAGGLTVNAATVNDMIQKQLKLQHHSHSSSTTTAHPPTPADTSLIADLKLEISRKSTEIIDLKHSLNHLTSELTTLRDTYNKQVIYEQTRNTQLLSELTVLRREVDKPMTPHMQQFMVRGCL